ncbi:hypothetical protein AGLY_016347 [Aphis glycines]|uniref:Uncharacterized protein n=1 Tax=Aphis glycines TaxID=307491 RepID=A0A6G0T017_APHGL|nr:hypothetical protein AGLY_016347 [Aphis glycines]
MAKMFQMICRLNLIPTSLIKRGRRNLYSDYQNRKSGLCFDGLNTPRFKFFYNYCKPNTWKILLTYEELCITFSRISTQQKFFYRYLYKNFKPFFSVGIDDVNFFNLRHKQNYLQIFAILTYFNCISESKTNIMIFYKTIQKKHPSYLILIHTKLNKFKSHLLGSLEVKTFIFTALIAFCEKFCIK